MKRLTPILLLAGLGCQGPKPAVTYVNPPGLAPPKGYTHAVAARGGRTIYVSGQIAVDAKGAVVGEGDLRAQTQQVFDNLRAALEASGAKLEDVVKITVFMTDLSGLQTFREVRDAAFPRRPPASSLVQVSRLVRPELLIEVEAVAVVTAEP